MSEFLQSHIFDKLCLSDIKFQQTHTSLIHPCYNFVHFLTFIIGYEIYQIQQRNLKWRRTPSSYTWRVSLWYIGNVMWWWWRAGPNNRRSSDASCYTGSSGTKINRKSPQRQTTVRIMSKNLSLLSVSVDLWYSCSFHLKVRGRDMKVIYKYM